MKLNYDLIPEELKREAADACFSFDIGEMQIINRKLQKYKQIKKPVDMEPLVNNDIWCEFSDWDNFKAPVIRCFLVDQLKNGRYVNGMKSFKYCRPLYGYWYSARNFNDVEELIDNLENAGFEVEFEYLNGELNLFCITGLQPNYCMPWRCE